MGTRRVCRGLLASVVGLVTLLAVVPVPAGGETGLSVTIAPLPDGADAQPETQLHDVACPSPATCFAVGSYGRPGSDQRPLVERLQDGQWTPVEPALPSDAVVSPITTLTSLSCASPTFCVAIGTYVSIDPRPADRPLVESWDGSGWTPRSPPLPRDASRKRQSTLEAISCAGVGA